MKNTQDVINTMTNKTIIINEKTYVLTPWYSQETIPYHKGIYQVMDRATTSVYFALWNGKNWSYKNNGVDWILNPNIIGQSNIKNPPWRGLVKLDF